MELYRRAFKFIISYFIINSRHCFEKIIFQINFVPGDDLPMLLSSQVCNLLEINLFDKNLSVTS